MQIINMKRLLRKMCDRVHAGLLVVEQHLRVPNLEALIKVVALDSEVDRMELELDQAVLEIFATQQPRAQELRLVYATAKIAHHIERMGDAVESLARQLATAEITESRDLLVEMISHVKDLFARSYAAMFEDDHARIQEIFELDDAVDDCQQAIVQIAKDIFLSAPRDPNAVERGLKLINIAAKLEKIADLCCNWAEQTDFAAHGHARRVLKKRRLRVVLLDDAGGQLASACAGMLTRDLSDGVDMTVATRRAEILGDGSKTEQLPHATILNRQFEASREFPIVRFEQVHWSRCFLLVNFGCALSAREREVIPHKTMVLEWEIASNELGDAETVLRQRLGGLASILARSDVSIDDSGYDQGP
jgi:phosphate transport system protein